MVRKELILLQWLSSVLGKNIGRAEDRTSDLLYSSPQHYRLSYGARQLHVQKKPNYVLYGPGIRNAFDRIGENIGSNQFLLLSQCLIPFHGQIPSIEPYFTLYYTIPTLKHHFLLETLWEKEKMLETSIFSFPHNIFHPSPNKFQIFSDIYFVIRKLPSIWTRLKFYYLVKDYGNWLPANTLKLDKSRIVNELSMKFQCWINLIS